MRPEFFLEKFPSPLELLRQKREKGEDVGGGGIEGQSKEMKAGRRKGRGKDGKSLPRDAGLQGRYVPTASFKPLAWPLFLPLQNGCYPKCEGHKKA